MIDRSDNLIKKLVTNKKMRQLTKAKNLDKIIKKTRKTKTLKNLAFFIQNKISFNLIKTCIYKS